MIHKGKKMNDPINKDMIKSFDLFGMAPKMFEHIEKYLKPKMHVLDVGTGRGVATRLLASRMILDPEAGGIIYSIDLSDDLQKVVAEIMEEEKTKKLVKFQIADVENLPFEDGGFDLVVTMNSIHHFSNPTRALNEMKRVLKNDGTLCIIDWSKKARFLPHKREDLLNLEDFKEFMNEGIVEEYSEKLWWFVAVRK